MNQYQHSQRQNNSTVVSLIIVLIVAAAVGFYLYNQNKPNYYNAANNGVYSNPSNSVRTAEEISNDLKVKEQSDPTKYFQLADIDNHPNLIGELILKGTIVCTSSVARFKDVIIEATYYTESNTLISSQQFPRYEIWGPGSRVTYKFKTTPPAYTKKINIQIVSAVPTE